MIQYWVKWISKVKVVSTARRHSSWYSDIHLRDSPAYVKYQRAESCRHSINKQINTEEWTHVCCNEDKGIAHCAPYILSHRRHSSREIDRSWLMYLEIEYGWTHLWLTPSSWMSCCTAADMRLAHRWLIHPRFIIDIKMAAYLFFGHHFAVVLSRSLVRCLLKSYLPFLICLRLP